MSDPAMDMTLLKELKKENILIWPKHKSSMQKKLLNIEKYMWF